MGFLGQLLYFSVHPNQLRSILQWYVQPSRLLAVLTPPKENMA
jgi:hypothetical protein